MLHTLANPVAESVLLRVAQGKMWSLNRKVIVRVYPRIRSL